MERKTSPAGRLIPALLLTAGVFALTCLTVLRFQTVMSDRAADYLAHSLWAVGLSPAQVLSSFYDGSEHLWHILMRLTFRLTGNLWLSAALVTAAANAAAYLLLFLLTGRVLPEKCPAWVRALLMFAVFVAGALWLPGWRYYAFAGTANTWHNPTNLMVRPFALAVFYMTVRIYERRRGEGQAFSFRGGFAAQFRQPVYRWWELILYPLCILFSVYAKPSFLQFFAPAILLFLLWDVIRTRGMLLPFCLKLALAYIPAGLILLTQFTSFFSGGVSLPAAGEAEAAAASASAGVAVYFLQPSFDGAGELLLRLGELLCRILRVSAFPLFLLCAAPRRFLSCAACRLGLTGAAVGRLEHIFLHETGSRASHGNFQWGQYLSAWVLWCAAMELFASLIREDSAAGRLARRIGLPLLGWHLLSGAAYLAAIFRGGDYFI